MSYFLAGQTRKIYRIIRIYQVFGLVIFIEFTLYGLDFPLFFKFGNNFRKSDRRRTVGVLHVSSANELFFKFFVIIKINKVQQFIQYGLAYIRFASDFGQYI